MECYDKDTIYFSSFIHYKNYYSGRKEWRKKGVSIALRPPSYADVICSKNPEIISICEQLKSTDSIIKMKADKVDTSILHSAYVDKISGVDLLKVGNLLRGHVILCICQRGWCHRWCLMGLLRLLGFKVKEIDYVDREYYVVPTI